MNEVISTAPFAQGGVFSSSWAVGTKALSAKTSPQPRGWQKSGGPTMDELQPIRAFDAANYLRDADDVAAYLQEAITEAKDDPALMVKALATVARAGNFSQLARDAGISREGLYKALSKEGNPSFATVMKVAQALGLRLQFHVA